MARASLCRSRRASGGAPVGRFPESPAHRPLSCFRRRKVPRCPVVVFGVRINRFRQVSIVTLSGLDGAGKRSQGHLVQGRLEQQGLRAAIDWLPIAYNPSVEAVRESLKSASRRLRPVRSSHGGTASAAGGSEADLARALVHRSAVARHLWVTVLAGANLVTNWRLALRYSRTHDVLLL